MKRYVVEVSFTGRCFIYVDAENEAEAQDKAMDSVELHSESNSETVKVELYGWDFATRWLHCDNGFMRPVADIKVCEALGKGETNNSL